MFVLLYDFYIYIKNNKKILIVCLGLRRIGAGAIH